MGPPAHRDAPLTPPWLVAVRQPQRWCCCCNYLISGRRPLAPLAVTLPDGSLSSDAAAATNVLHVSDTSPFEIGQSVVLNIVLNLGQDNEEESIVDGFGSLILRDPLKHDHRAGETIHILPDDDCCAIGCKFLPAATAYTSGRCCLQAAARQAVCCPLYTCHELYQGKLDCCAVHCECDCCDTCCCCYLWCCSPSFSLLCRGRIGAALTAAAVTAAAALTAATVI